MEAWEEIRLPRYEKTPFNPEVKAGSEGITIWAPAKVKLRKGAVRVPVFGAVRLGEKTLEDLGIGDRHPLRAVVVGAILGDNPFVGNAVLQAPLFPAPPGSVVTEYFAVDLLECTGSTGEGTYFVFASVGAFTAQPIKIEASY